MLQDPGRPGAVGWRKKGAQPFAAQVNVLAQPAVPHNRRGALGGCGGILAGGAARALPLCVRSVTLGAQAGAPQRGIEQAPWLPPWASGRWDYACNLNSPLSPSEGFPSPMHGCSRLPAGTTSVDQSTGQVMGPLFEGFSAPLAPRLGLCRRGFGACQGFAPGSSSRAIIS